jgi:restriction endonuclease-like protein
MTAVHLPRERPSSAAAVADHFVAQRGLILPSQLRAAGVGLPEEQLRVAQGDWERLAPGVIALRGAASDWSRGPMIATLCAPSAAITAGTALRLHRSDGYADYEDLYLAAKNGARPRVPDGFSVWQSRVLGDDDLMTLDGIRTVTLPVALAHAYAIDDAELVGRAVDDALRRRSSPAWMKQVADRWTRRGVPGSGRLAAALNERCDKRLPRSWFERLARKALAKHGIEMEHEVPVRDGRRKLAILDLADVRWKVGVECQSWAWHATPRARRADAERKRRLTRLGWDVIELWWSALGTLMATIDDVHQAIDRQRRLVGSA